MNARTIAGAEKESSMSENKNPDGGDSSEESTTQEYNPYANLPERNPEPEYKSEKDCDTKRDDEHHRTGKE